MRVLLMEDDQKIARSVQRRLEGEGHRVDIVEDGAEGAEQAISGLYDLILLGLPLRGSNGLEVLRRVRQADGPLPVVVISARTGVKSMVRCLDMGADDYLVKPFSLEELSARIRAVSRRAGRPFERRLLVGQLELDRVEHVAIAGDDDVKLTEREFQLLEYFMLHVDEPLTRAMLADQVWGYQFESDTNVIDVYVNYVRKKLKMLELNPLLTVRGVGYRLDSSKCWTD